MTPFAEALRALLARLESGGELALRAYDFLETRGAENFTVYARELLRRERDGALVFSTELRTVPYGSKRRGVTERHETRRLSEPELFDALCAEPHLRQRLGLPAPTEHEHFDRVLERLRAGERFERASADDGGGHSGRRLSGERSSLRREGDEYVSEHALFEADAAGVVRDTAAETVRYSEDQLAAALRSDPRLRALVGLPAR